MNLETLVESLLAASHAPAFIQFRLNACCTLESVPNCLLLWWDRANHADVAKITTGNGQFDKVLELQAHLGPSRSTLALLGFIFSGDEDVGVIDKKVNAWICHCRTDSQCGAGV